ncbi:MAG: DUF3240 family protein [Methylococcales bacterium]|nr:DUF3240 family protein [Methylococcales bacterium]
MDNEEFLVILTVPYSLEEAIIDCLLTFEVDYGFSSFPVSAHDHKNKGLSLAEQVRGKQQQIRFQMYVAKHDLPTLTHRLKTEFSGSGITYSVLPVIERGVI